MASFNLPMQQSYVGASYRYSLKYYEDRDSDEYDQAHEFNLKADHRFSERYSASFTDTFVYASEPELQDPGLGSPLRTEADAYRNFARVNFDGRLNETVGLGLGYFNGFYNYTDGGNASRSAQLDRFEHLINLDALYRVRGDLDALIGYQLGAVDYTSDSFLFPQNPPTLNPDGSPNTDKADIRNSTSHYLYVGVDGDITSKLKVSSRIGAQYTDFDDLDQDAVTPYAQNSLTYTYLPGSYLQLGLSHRRNATDQVGAPGDTTADQESTSVYAQLSHRITAKLTGGLFVQGQHSVFQEGAFDGDADNFLLFGSTLDYQINQFLAAEAGYNFDRLDSDLDNRSFTRNRVFVGVRASY